MQNSVFPLKIGDKARISTITTSVQHSTEGLKQYNKGKHKGGEMSLFTFDMVAYLENLKESTPYLMKKC